MSWAIRCVSIEPRLAARHIRTYVLAGYVWYLPRFAIFLSARCQSFRLHLPCVPTNTRVGEGTLIAAGEEGREAVEVEGTGGRRPRSPRVGAESKLRQSIAGP